LPGISIQLKLFEFKHFAQFFDQSLTAGPVVQYKEQKGNFLTKDAQFSL
jgi:hypothetical protein